MLHNDKPSQIPLYIMQLKNKVIHQFSIRQVDTLWVNPSSLIGRCLSGGPLYKLYKKLCNPSSKVTLTISLKLKLKLRTTVIIMKSFLIVLTLATAVLASPSGILRRQDPCERKSLNTQIQIDMWLIFILKL
jgi:hypothetical protein